MVSSLGVVHFLICMLTLMQARLGIPMIVVIKENFIFIWSKPDFVELPKAKYGFQIKY